MKRISWIAGLLVLGVLPLSAFPRVVGDGAWHTSGNQILDAAGNAVHFSGLNWSGFETPNFVLHGLWSNVDGQGHSRSLSSYLDQIQSLGFNLIRLPFSGDMCKAGQMPASGTIDFTANPDLQGLSCLQVIDAFLQECGSRGIRVILDYHRMQAGSASENGLWYIPGDPTYTEQFWISNWQMIATRYASNPTVVGADLFNEPHATTWDADGVNPTTNWKDAAKRCANAVQAIAPGWLICVQGVGQYNGQAGWWGAVHIGFLTNPLTLTVANRLVLEIHDYGRDVSDQPWFHASNFPANLEADDWNTFWEFISTQNLAPIWVGEWGSKDDPTDSLYSLDHPWLQAFHDFIKSKQYCWTWWTWSPLSADTGGILNADFTTVNQTKMALLQDVLYPAFTATGTGAPPPPPPPPPTPAPGSPYGGTAAAISGTIQIENYDLGGLNVGYFNSDNTNHFGQYRSDGVSIEVTSDTGGGYDVGWVTPGEWLAYTVDVASAGTYLVSFRIASDTTGGTLHLASGSTNLTGSVTVPGTGGWQTWATTTSVPITLSAGLQTIHLVFDSGSYNLNYMTFTGPDAGSPAPGPGSPPTPSSGASADSPSGGGGGGGGGGCGCTGLEGFLALAAARLARKRRGALRRRRSAQG